MFFTSRVQGQNEFPEVAEIADTSIYDYQSLQETAMYIGGNDSLNRYVMSQLKLQKSLNFTSKMKFSLVVNQDSSVEDIKLITTTRNVDPYAKSAAIQALKLTNKQWIPGIRNNEYVRSRKVVEIDISW